MKFSEWLEIREEKDACYHKVKNRYSVFPSAYASGALVRCRKVGAKNWGNKTKKEQVEINESLKEKKQYDDAMQAIMSLKYKGIDAETAPSKEIRKALIDMHKKIPERTDLNLFIARIKSIAKENTKPEDFKENTFKLEKERGLKGWFDRKTGGWIDCKASKKGNLVPCGRKKAGKGAEREYPACRPTLSACNKKGTRRKKSSKRISWE
jgi:hypothetical protein